MAARDFSAARPAHVAAAGRHEDVEASEEHAAAAIVARAHMQLALHEAAAGVAVAACTRSERAFDATMGRFEVEMQAIELAEIEEVLGEIGETIVHSLPRTIVDVESQLPDLLAPALLRISDGLSKVERGALREQCELVALRSELERAHGGVQAAEASLDKEGAKRSRLESDAADVAESLLEADLTMCVCCPLTRAPLLGV